MAPQGWLDIHAHFYLPSTDEEAEALAIKFRSACFMVPGPVTWDADSTLAYNDRAGVQMQMLSYIPQDHAALRKANDFGASLVEKHPTRFGLLAALPTDDAEASLEEIRRTDQFPIVPDGFATSTTYNGVGLGDPRLEPLWAALDRRAAVMHVHPNAYAAPAQGRPAPLIEVAFDTARTVTDMLYAGVFRRYPGITFVLAHCGGALPVLSGRLALLGTQAWVPNPQGLTRTEVEEQLGRLWVDTAATARTGLAPAAQMVGWERCVYGADCGVPCSTEETMDENMADVVALEEKTGREPGGIGRKGWDLFPEALRRVERLESRATMQ